MARKIEAVLELDTKKAQGGVNKLKGALVGLAAGVGVAEIGRLADEFTQLQNRLNSVSDSNAEAASAFNLVKQIAKDTRSDLGSVGDLFTDITIATEEMGLAQNEVANIASTFSKALKISGADAGTASGAIRQFGQALASGVLRGDEFNSIMEANPAFMREVAKTLGVTTGDLRKMAEEGKLTADVMVAATDEISGAIDADFAKTSATIGESFQQIRNNIISLIGEIENRTGIFQKLANVINLVAENLNFVGAAIAFAFGSAAVGVIMQGVVAFNRVAKAIRGAAGAAAILQAVTGVGAVKALAGLAAGTAAYFALEAAVDDATESTEEFNKTMGDPPSGPNSQQLLAEREAQKDEEEQITEQQKEQARILARQQEEFAAITGELRIQSEDFATNLQLQLDMLGASEQQKTLLQEQADIEADRSEALRNLNELTLISAEERAQKEAEINEEYDERIDKMEEFLTIAERVKMVLNAFNIGVNAFAPLNEANEQLKLQQELIKTFSAVEREELQRSFDLMSGVRQAEADLQLKIAKDVAEQRAKLGRDLTEAELESIAKRFEYEAAVIADLKTKTTERTETYLQELRTMREETRSFGFGVSEAFMRMNEEITNMAEFGGRIVDTMADGFTNAIVNFVETGKLSFKDLFKTLVMELVKLAANKMFLALFSPEGGIFGGLFAGFKQHGGSIPAGKFGIAGEAGPEIVTGPAHVTSTRDTAKMLGGGTTQNIYINAVDTQSFKTALAKQDPEFIFALSQAGARRLPA